MNREASLRKPTATTKDSRPIYVRLADELAELLETGQLKAGDRLPSVRRLVAQKGVSATTAIAALRAMEHRGFAVARPQAGYFAKPRRVNADDPAPTLPPPAPPAEGGDGLLVP